MDIKIKCQDSETQVEIVTWYTVSTFFCSTGNNFQECNSRITRDVNANISLPPFTLPVPGLQCFDLCLYYDLFRCVL